MNLRLLQLGDSALPIGSYSHSWGLEAAVERGIVKDAADLERWVSDWLHHAVGPCEGVVVAGVCRAVAGEDWPVVARANELLEAGITPNTLRHASREQGEQLLSLAETWPWASDSVARLRQLAPGPWYHPVVFATLAAAARATPEEALLLYVHQAALGCIGAGVKAIPIGHTHGQQILARLHDRLEELADELADRDLETAGSFCPAYEVLCHAQTQLYTRLFRS
jgi:urease accessory protein